MSDVSCVNDDLLLSSKLFSITSVPESRTRSCLSLSLSQVESKPTTSLELKLKFILQKFVLVSLVTDLITFSSDEAIHHKLQLQHRQRALNLTNGENISRINKNY